MNKLTTNLLLRLASKTKTYSTVSVIRRFSSLNKLLLEMQREHIPVLKAIRKKKKEQEVKSNFPASHISLQVIGNGALGAPKSLYVFTDQKRYIFNCGEGTQRLAQEHRFKLSKFDNLFITSKSWENIGGLPGLALTIQDIGIPEINLHGTPELEVLFEATKRFCVLNELRFISVDCVNNAYYEDNLFRIEYVIVHQTKSDSSSESSEGSIVEDEVTDYYSYKPTGNKRAFDNNNDLASRKLKKNDPDDSATKVEKNSIFKDPLNLVFSYICRPKVKQGTLLIEKCVELGVPKGPLLGKLKAGEDITLENGKIIKATDVKSPDTPGPVFIVVDCPSEEYLDSLVENEKLGIFHTGNTIETRAEVIVHFTCEEMLRHPKYVSWMNKFPVETNHLILNKMCSGMGSDGVHRMQTQLNLVDKNLFPPLGEVNCDHEGVKSFVPNYSELNEVKGKIIYGKTLLKYHIRPETSPDFSSAIRLNYPEYAKEIKMIPDFDEANEELQNQLNSLTQIDGEKYPNILFLGTGSSIPNKTRNTSGILLEIGKNTNFVLDCGEGTFGQMIRFYGKQSDGILSQLKGIYISHLHADHHIGLIGVLQGRANALKRLGLPQTPVFLIAPEQIQFWLNVYHKYFEKIKHHYRILPNAKLLMGQESFDVKDEALEVLSLKDIETTRVKHCPNSYGVAVMGDGWKLTYSGDTMPCENLVKLGQGSDLLIHEATLEDEMEDEARIKMHSTTSQAIEVGKEMEAQFTLLTHFSQRYSKIPKILDEFDQNVGVAFDNMKVRLCDLPKLPLIYSILKIMFIEQFESLEQKTLNRQRRKERDLKREMEILNKVQEAAKSQ